MLAKFTGKEIGQVRTFLFNFTRKARKNPKIPGADILPALSEKLKPGLKSKIRQEMRGQSIYSKRLRGRTFEK